MPASKRNFMSEGTGYSVGGPLLSDNGAREASALTVWKSLKVSLWEICDPAEIWVARFLEARSGSAMSDGGDIQGQLIKIGLTRPFHSRHHRQGCRRDSRRICPVGTG